MVIEHDTQKSVSHFESVHGLVVGLVHGHQLAVPVVELLRFIIKGLKYFTFLHSKVLFCMMVVSHFSGRRLAGKTDELYQMRVTNAQAA